MKLQLRVICSSKLLQGVAKVELVQPALGLLNTSRPTTQPHQGSRQVGRSAAHPAHHPPLAAAALVLPATQAALGLTLAGSFLDTAIAQAQPIKLALELGTYVGYSALRVARLLPPGARLVCIDPLEVPQRVALPILEHAGE